MPDNYEYVKSGFLSQDLIRTVNLSFQPYLPFSQTYTMQLQGAQGTAAQDASYWRVAPPVPQDYVDKGPIDSTYPFSLRRNLFGGDARSATSKITAVARNKNRINDISSKAPKGADYAVPLAQELSKLLNVSYAFDGRSFVEDNYTDEAQRDAHELEVGMFSREIDELLGGGSTVAQGPTRDRKENFTYTSKTGKGFDILLSEHRHMNDYMSNIWGSDYQAGIDFLEISQGVGEKKMLDVGNIEGLSEAEVLRKTINNINTEIDKYNAKISEAIGPHIAEAQQEMGGFDISMLPPEFLAEMARETGLKNKGRTSPDYMIRQIMDRFAFNSFRPYYFSGQLSESSYAIFILTPELEGNIPQIVPVSSNTIRIINNAAVWKQGFEAYLKTAHVTDKEKIAEISARTIASASNRAFATRATLESTGRYQLANVTLGAQNELDVTLSDEGTSSVHKMTLQISEKLKKDIEAYYSTTKMKGQFKIWYEKMMKAANDLTKTWYRGSSKMVGMRGKPLSEEWRAMSSGWSDGNGYKKKYIGVWNSANEQAWKDGVGSNFSISPFLESRRDLSGGSMSAKFSRVDERL